MLCNLAYSTADLVCTCPCRPVRWQKVPKVKCGSGRGQKARVPRRLLRAVIWSNFILQLNVILVLERSDFTNWEIRIIFNWCDWICEEVVNEQCWIVEIWPKSNSLVNSVITISRNIKGFLNLNRLTESWLKHAIANNERIWKNLPTKLLKRLLLFKAL